MSDWHDDSYPELRDGPPWVMQEMITIEPQLAPLIEPDPAATDLANRIRRAAAAGAPVVLVGCGSSLHAALAIADLLEGALAAAGTPQRVEARDALEAALEPRAGGICVGVTHDGGTHATTLALEAARVAGSTTALITHRPEGACSGPAELVVATPIPDRSWCHTVAYVSALLAGAGVAACIAGTPIDPTAVAKRMSSLCEDLIGAADAAAQLLAQAPRVVSAGSGCDRVTSRELVLKLEEGPHLPAAHRDLEILLHGHLVACDAGAPIVLFAVDPRGRPRRLERAGRLVDAAAVLDLPIVLIADREGARLGDRPAVVHCLDTGTATLPEPLDALLAGAFALQTLTLAAIHARGTNPDLIRREQAPWRAAAGILDEPGW